MFKIILILFVSMLVVYFVKSDQGVVSGSTLNNVIITNIEKQIKNLKIKNGYLQKRLADFKSNYFNILQEEHLNVTINLFEEDHELDPYGVSILSEMEQSLWFLRQTLSLEQPNSAEQIEFKSTLLKLFNSTCISQQKLFGKEVQALHDDLQKQLDSLGTQLARTSNKTEESLQQIINHSEHNLQQSMNNSQINLTDGINKKLEEIQKLFDKEVQALHDDLQKQLDSFGTQYANYTNDVLIQLARTANKTEENLQQSINYSQINLTDMSNGIYKKFEEIQKLFDKEILGLHDDLQKQLDSLGIQSTNNTKDILIQIARTSNKTHENQESVSNSQINLKESIINSQSNLKDMSIKINNKLEDIKNSQLTKLNDLAMQMKKIKYPESCAEAVGDSGISGIYNVLLTTQLNLVHCNKDGWLLIQRQFDGPLSFNRGWVDYRNGFGDPNGQYWLGLETLREITMKKHYELYILMTDFKKIKTFARYDKFLIGFEAEKYPIKELGTFSGNCTTDSLKSHSAMPFLTFDNDNDLLKKENCALYFGSGWWHKSCFDTNLNEKVRKDTIGDMARGLYWKHGSYIEEAAMYIREK